VLTLVMILGLAGLLGAQEPTPTPGAARSVGGLAFVDEYEVTVVNIDAYVTDKKGRTVTDLSMEDFRVLQDGEPKVLTNFELFTEDVYRHHFTTPIPGLPTPTPAPEPEVRQPEPQPIWIVLYIDNENLKPLDRNRVLRRVEKFVRENLQPGVQMMVVSYQRSFEVHQTFTADASAILGAVRGVKLYTGGRTERNSARREAMAMLRDMKDQESTRSGYEDGVRGKYHSAYRLILGIAKEEANSVLFSADALRSVITRLAGLPGRKAIVYISNGLPMVAGLDLFYEFAHVYNDTSILTEISRYDRSQVFQSLASSANAQGVTFYTIGAQGLDMGGMGSAENQYMQNPLSASVGVNNLLDTLRYMADTTGGLAIVNTNDFTAGLERIQKDLYTYYSLGYTLTASGSDKVHHIEVKLPNHPDYDVRYRRRFVEKSIETQVQDKVVSAMMFDLEDNPMHIDLEAGDPAPASEDRWMVPIHLSFPIRKVALIPQGDDYVGRVVMFLGARDTEGKQSDLVRQEHEVRIPMADYEEAQRRRFGIDARLLMEAGSYRVVVALLDPITREDSYQSVRTTISEG
jgi:VWFA-related protein